MCEMLFFVVDKATPLLFLCRSTTEFTPQARWIHYSRNHLQAKFTYTQNKSSFSTANSYNTSVLFISSSGES